MSATRRDFLKTAAGSAALAMLSTRAGDALAVSEPGEAGLSWSKAPCRFCGVGCGVEVGVKGGRAVAVRGDRRSPVNKGLLCAKGYHLPGILYGADRLTTPQIRKDGKLVDATWEEALDLMASKLKASLDKKGPTSVGFYGSGQWTVWDGYAALKFMKGGLGSNNIDPNARLCMASAVTGFITSFGIDEPMGCYDDLDLADVTVLWGNNMAEQHPVLFGRVMNRKRADKAVKLYELTTRGTPTTPYCDSSWMFTPHTDLAIGNAICQQIIAKGKVNKDFVDKHTVFRSGKTNIGWGLDNTPFKDKPEPIDFKAYREFLQDYTPEKVEKMSGVPAAAIIELAEAYADPNKKVVSLWCMGVNQHTRGTWMNNIIYNIHLLTGKISKPGDGPFSLTGQPSACGTAREVGTLAHALPGGRVVMKPEHRAFTEKIWGVKPGTIPAKPGFHAVRMFRALETGELNWLWVQVTNPMVTMPNLNRFAKGPKRDDTFIIVSDVYPTESTAIADVVLPSSLWVERQGMFGNSERRTQHFAKAIDPPGQCWDDTRQIVALANKVGLGSLFPKQDDKDLERKLFEEYRKFTLGKKDLAPWKIYLDTHGGVRWPYVNGRETRWRYIEGEDPYVPKGAGFSFYGKKKLGNKAIIWQRPYEAPAEVPDKDYPLWLCTGRVLEHWHSGTMTRRVPQLHRAAPAAYVELHPDDARKLSVADGETVRLVSRRGKIDLAARVGGRRIPAKGGVFVPFFDESKLINELTLDSYCPISKEPDYKKCAIRVEKIKEA